MLLFLRVGCILIVSLRMCCTLQLDECVVSLLQDCAQVCHHIQVLTCKIPIIPAS